MGTYNQFRYIRLDVFWFDSTQNHYPKCSSRKRDIILQYYIRKTNYYQEKATANYVKYHSQN